MKSGAKTYYHKLRRALRFDELAPWVRKTIVGVVGGSILLAGFALLFLPGPAFVVIPLGLAVLATEFGWARHYLKKAQDLYHKVRARRRKRNA
jgi:hypothetical protein